MTMHLVIDPVHDDLPGPGDILDSLGRGEFTLLKAYYRQSANLLSKYTGFETTLPTGLKFSLTLVDHSDNLSDSLGNTLDGWCQSSDEWVSLSLALVDRATNGSCDGAHSWYNSTPEWLGVCVACGELESTSLAAGCLGGGGGISGCIGGGIGRSISGSISRGVG